MTITYATRIKKLMTIIIIELKDNRVYLYKGKKERTRKQVKRRKTQKWIQDPLILAV
jgi:hypothetical protein